jgi:hypothetical protein
MNNLSNRPQNKNFGIRVKHISSIVRLEQNKLIYYTNPKYCKHCNNVISYEKRTNKFCSHSCAAIFTNKLKPPKSIKNKLQISKKLTNHPRYTKIYICRCCKKYHGYGMRCPKPKPVKPQIVGKYCKIYYRTCKTCKSIYIAKTVTQYCNKCITKTTANRARYRFTFNIYEYPDLFDLNLLTQYGWYAPGGKSGRWNITGLSRDHKVSISEAILNNYDPFYITHMLNCELMPHTTNCKKHIKSSITYTKLVELVDAYQKYNVDVDGFEPTSHKGPQIYSLLPLTVSDEHPHYTL